MTLWQAHLSIDSQLASALKNYRLYSSNWTYHNQSKFYLKSVHFITIQHKLSRLFLFHTYLFSWRSNRRLISITTYYIVCSRSLTSQHLTDLVMNSHQCGDVFVLLSMFTSVDRSLHVLWLHTSPHSTLYSSRKTGLY